LGGFRRRTARAAGRMFELDALGAKRIIAPNPFLMLGGTRE
jgi:hypothetical protein